MGSLLVLLLLLSAAAAINLPLHYLHSVGRSSLAEPKSAKNTRSVSAEDSGVDKRAFKAFLPTRVFNVLRELEAMLSPERAEEVMPYRFSFKGRK